MSAISLIHFNSRSLCNKLNDFHDLLCGSSGQLYDVVCVTETWLRDTYPDSLLTNGAQYSVFRCDRPTRIGGGSAIFVNNHLSASRLALPFDYADIEVVVIEIHTCMQSLIICCIYNPPGYNVQCVKTICEIIHYLCNKFCCVCILGDFNMPVLVDSLVNHTPVPNVLIPLKDALYAHSLDQIVDSPSRVANYLDLVFCSNALMHDSVCSLPPLGNSDHSCQTFNIFTEYLGNFPTENTQSYYDFNNADYAQFKLWLDDIDWFMLLSTQSNVEEMWLAFMRVIDQGRSLFIPVKLKKPVARASYPAYIKRLQARKRKLWQCRHNPNNMNSYKTVAGQYKAAVETYHVKKENQLLKLNSKHFFKHLNKKLCSHNSIPNLRKDNIDITTDFEKANEFLSTFSKSFTSDNGLLGNIHGSFYSQQVDIHPDFSPASIAKHLKLVNSQSSAGPDGYPGKFWHSLHSTLASPLSIIFNMSFITGCLPSCWKHSVITPVFKKGDPTSPSNYRPISLTSIACKVMESAVRDALLAHFERNKLLNPDQHGFLTRHSTGSQLLECINDWTDAIEQGNCTDVCYIDFSHAFDSVSLAKLIHKFLAYGVSGRCINWLTAFLIDRTMCVKSNNVCSRNIMQLSGVPQGSVLGPICFVLFVNDISNCVKYCKLKLYADDVKLYFHFGSENWSDLMQRDLDAIAEWAQMWQLSISINKTYLLHIGVHNPRHVYSINGTNIAAVDTVKDLGVYVSSDLKWSVHVNEVAKKANKVANVILHAFRCHNVDLYMSAFAIYVKPILEYCCYVWNPVLCRDIDVIENVLRAYTRRVFKKCGLPRMNYADRLILLDVMSSERSRFVSCITMFYNVYNKFVCCNILQNLICPAYMLNLRGHNKRLMIPFCRSSARKNYFVFRFLHVWNNLPASVVSTNVSKTFRNHITNIDMNALAVFRF